MAAALSWCPERCAPVSVTTGQLFLKFRTGNNYGNLDSTVWALLAHANFLMAEEERSTISTLCSCCFCLWCWHLMSEKLLPLRPSLLMPLHILRIKAKQHFALFCWDNFNPCTPSKYRNTDSGWGTISVELPACLKQSLQRHGKDSHDIIGWVVILIHSILAEKLLFCSDKNIDFQLSCWMYYLIFSKYFLFCVACLVSWLSGYKSIFTCLH